MRTNSKNFWVYLSVLCVAWIAALIPELACADGGVALNTRHSSSIFTIAPYDQSILYLSELFGNMPPLLNGTGSQLMGHLFKIFNTALLTLGIIFTGYTTFVGILNTAGEGEMLGKGWHSIWVPIRTVAGIALLIPTASGYCVCQLFMMWLLLQGIGAADTLTGTIVDYMESDMPVFAPADGVLSSPSSSTGKSVSTFYDSTITTVFQGLSCMQATYKHYNTTGKQTPTITTTAASATSSYTVTYDFQAIPDAYPIQEGAIGLPNPNTTPSSCGILTITGDTSDSSSATILAKAISQGLNAIIPSLSSTAYYMVNQDSNDENTVMQDTFNFVGGSGFLTELENTYASLISQAYFTMNTATVDATGDSAVDNSSLYKVDNSSFYEDIRNLGWVTLGTIYWDMAKSTGSTYSTLQKDAVISWNSSNSGTGATATWTTATEPNIGDSKEDYAGDEIWTKGNTWANQFIQDLQTSRNSSSGSTYQSAGANDAGKMGTNAIAAITMGTLASMQDKLSNNRNPMIAAQELGHEIALVVEITSMALTAALLIAGGLMSMGSSMSSGFAVFQAIMATVIPGLTLFMGVLLALAGTLSVVIPMIPALAYFLAVIAWLIATLETIVAAPIVAIGVLHPDGQHQVWGKAEPAVMLIINMFLRPSLIVIGLAAGVILSFITLQFVNFGFNQAILNLMGDKAPTSIEAMLFLTTYVGVVLACVNKSFSTIDVIPEQVMRWIAGGEGTKFGSGQEAMQKVQSGQEGQSQRGGDSGAQESKSAGEGASKGVSEGVRADDSAKDAKAAAGDAAKARTQAGRVSQGLDTPEHQGPMNKPGS